MKNWIVSLATVVVTLATPALAHANGKEPKAQKVFATQFTGAENVKWMDVQGGYHRVIFTLNGIRAEAYYDEDANLLGTVRNLFFNQLPLRIIQALNNKVTGAVTIDILEITNEAGTQYRIVLEQKEKRFSVKLDEIGSILEKRKIKK